jgi:predicted  nucleic acid-binding Zn-ribbon protein
MSALDRLKEKVDAWKQRIEELEQENHNLREQDTHGGNGEIDALRAQLEGCQKTVADLRNDIAEKDQEIEAIISKVEALID